MNNKRVQQHDEINCNNYATPYKIVCFNKLLKSIDKEQNKNIINHYNLKESKKNFETLCLQ